MLYNSLSLGNMPQNVPQFGLYFYAWYSQAKWNEHKVLHTPRIGYYHSADELAIEWQVEQIVRTGVDYIVFEMVSPQDWCYQGTVQTIAKMLPLLEIKGIGYTFLCDVWVDHEQPHAHSFDNMLRVIEDFGWLKKSLKDPAGKPLLLVFNPDCLEAQAIITNHPQLSVRFAGWIPCWSTFGELGQALNERKDPNHFDRFFKGVKRHDDTSIKQVLEPMHYFQFWQITPHTIAMNGFASVVPGYDDLLMQRKPQMAQVVERHDGRTLVEQFAAAMGAGAEQVLIYGWNEYFEATTIEPTLEYGDFYVELTRELIGQVRRGESVHFPAGLGQPQVAPPQYLSPALKRAAQKYTDKLPRWDKDDYVACIEACSAIDKQQGHIFFRNIRVINDGLKPWRIESGADPIRLGVKLHDPQAAIVREGRAELSVQDVAVGQKLEADIALEVAGLPAGDYIAEIDLVWEGKFWFAVSKKMSITLP